MLILRASRVVLHSPNKLVLLGKEWALAVPQYIFFYLIFHFNSPQNKGRVHALPICFCIGIRLLEECKSNSPNNSKTAIGTSPNISYWERIIENCWRCSPFYVNNGTTLGWTKCNSFFRCRYIRLWTAKFGYFYVFGLIEMRWCLVARMRGCCMRKKNRQTI